MNSDLQERLSKLPKVDALLAAPSAGELLNTFSRARVVVAVRAQLEALRQQMLQGDGQSHEFADAAFFEAVEGDLRAEAKPSLRRVINATGIVLHTNLGRAPLAKSAIEAVAEVARGYSNLEYDLAAGKRGSRHAHVERLLRELTGAEAA
ncbi:MAG: L-seryl-tRNA(Sec) selenium transferase, partial [Candidatus Hydrogenedentes bacterium]|nr:L-seryl-tRNA(Sec) selenium transferase [Candidatus Hydrogenedentota bacterium]